MSKLVNLKANRMRDLAIGKVKVYTDGNAPALHLQRQGVEEIFMYSDMDELFGQCTNLFYDRRINDDSSCTYPDSVPTNTVGILFTSGMDSTLLAVRAIREGKNVLPIINLFNCDSRQFNLLTSVVWNKLRGKYGHQMLRPCFCLRNVHCNVVPHCFSGMFQQPINMFSLGYIPESILSNLVSIQAGFVKGDDAIPYIRDMRRLYKSVWKLSHGIRHPGHNNVPFTPLFFPLQDTEKADIRKELESYGDETCTLSCENPRVDVVAWNDGYGIIRISECGCCHSCGRKREYDHPLKIMDVGFRCNGNIGELA